MNAVGFMTSPVNKIKHWDYYINARRRMLKKQKADRMI